MKKRMPALLLIFALCFALAAPVMAADEPERGVLSYEEIIAPQYEGAGTFSDGLAAVKKDGKWGYIDADNNVVIPFLYDVAHIFSEGYAVVGTYGTRTYTEWWSEEEIEEETIYFGFVDTAGNYKPFLYTEYDYNAGDYVATELCVGREYYSDGEPILFYGGWVRFGSEWDNLYNTKGELLRLGYHSPQWVPTEGLIPMSDEGYNWYVDMEGNTVLDESDIYEWTSVYYDVNGNKTDDWEYAVREDYSYVSYVLPFNQGLAPVWLLTGGHDYATDEYYKNYLLGFVDKSGNWVIEPQFGGYYFSGIYGEFRLFSGNGLACVSKDGSFGAIDKTGKTVVPFLYDELWPFLEGKAAFCQDGLYGYIDSTGNVIIPAQYEATSGFGVGMAAAYDGTNAFLIDAKGNKIAGSETLDPNSYFHVSEDGSATTITPGEYVTILKDGKYGFGKVSYLPPLPEKTDMSDWAYEEVVAAIEEDLIPVSLQNQYKSNITRVDFSQMVIQALCSIQDIERDELVLEKTGKSMSEWYGAYPFKDSTNADLIAAYALGILTGYTDGTVKPYNQISREEAAVIVTRTAKVLGMNTEGAPVSDFADRDKLASWSAAGVDFVRSACVMNGVGGNLFDPSGTYTREQSYACAYRLLLALLNDAQ